MAGTREMSCAVSMSANAVRSRKGKVRSRTPRLLKLDAIVVVSNDERIAQMFRWPCSTHRAEMMGGCYVLGRQGGLDERR